VVRTGTLCTWARSAEEERTNEREDTTEGPETRGSATYDLWATGPPMSRRVVIEPQLSRERPRFLLYSEWLESPTRLEKLLCGRSGGDDFGWSTVRGPLLLGPVPCDRVDWPVSREVAGGLSR